MFRRGVKHRLRGLIITVNKKPPFSRRLIRGEVQNIILLAYLTSHIARLRLSRICQLFVEFLDWWSTQVGSKVGTNDTHNGSGEELVERGRSDDPASKSGTGPEVRIPL
jgi:hypothetical protein